MKRHVALAFLVVCSGCGKDDAESATAPCEITLVSTVPAADAQDAYYRAAIEALFDDADPTARIGLHDAQGADVAGSVTTSTDGKTVSFLPAAPLMPSTSYSADVWWCGGTEAIAFTTSSLGEPLDAALVGNTYLVHFGEGRFVEPPVVGTMLGTLVKQDILLTITAGDAASLTMLGALTTAKGTAQDFCAPTIDFPTPADFSASPYWMIQADSTTLAVAGNDVMVEDLEISGTFSTDGTRFGGGVLAGTIDTSLLGGLVGVKDNPAYICGMAEPFGAECTTCPDGRPYCLGLVVDQLAGDRVQEPVRPVAERDCDAQCPASVANPKCEKYYVPK